MFEATTQTAIRNGIESAHDARGAAFRSLIAALFGRANKKAPAPRGKGLNCEAAAFS